MKTKMVKMLGFLILNHNKTSTVKFPVNINHWSNQKVSPPTSWGMSVGLSSRIEFFLMMLMWERISKDF